MDDGINLRLQYLARTDDKISARSVHYVKQSPSIVLFIVFDLTF